MKQNFFTRYETEMAPYPCSHQSPLNPLHTALILLGFQQRAHACLYPQSHLSSCHLYSANREHYGVSPSHCLPTLNETKDAEKQYNMCLLSQNKLRHGSDHVNAIYKPFDSWRLLRRRLVEYGVCKMGISLYYLTICFTAEESHQGQKLYCPLKKYRICWT